MASTHQFSPLDEIMPPIFSGLIVGFPCENSQKDKIYSVLQRSLSALVADDCMPFLNGEILQEGTSTLEQNGRLPPTLKIREPVREIELVLNDLTLPGRELLFSSSYEELKAAGFPMHKLDGNVLAPLAGVATTARIMAPQVNFIGGGCLLSVCFSHSFSDAYGIYLIMAEWARLCRREQGYEDPQALQSISSQVSQVLESNPANDSYASIPFPPALAISGSNEIYETLKQRPELWKLLGLDWRGSKCSPPSVAPFRSTSFISDTRIFNISSTSLLQIKKDATPSPSDVAAGGSPWVSTNDSLVGFLWRHITLARFPSAEKSLPAHVRGTSFVSVAIDGRKGLGIPMNYIGNVVFCCMTALPIRDLQATETGLGTIASQIRAQVTANREPQMMKDAVALAASIPDVRNLTNAFPSWFAEDLVTTSWIDLPFYDLDFGPILGESGRIETFRMPRGQFDGICSIQPRHVDNSVDVVIGLEVEQMKVLLADDEFARRVTFIS